MVDIKKWKNICDAKEIVKTLKEKKYNAIYVDNLLEAKELVLNLIPKGSSIAVGGSVTLEKMNIIDSFRSSDYKFYDRYQNLPFEEIVEIMRQSMLADYLVTSTNAITKNGELVNMDSTGNRAAAMIFGPKKVIVVAGVNKVVEDLKEAEARIKKVAILNAKRISHKTPCTENGICTNCLVKDRVCNYVSIINNGQKFHNRFTIIIVGEEIGF
ncbi:Uncharacterised ACR, YkgG family COG1556 [Clostridium cavendishii DSM 21758]|uniref:Uncharacterized ACR, YkgG family COG1556 n=1 Tax=Clostridium cavendishii DSM 21758 TaxID=1121302 RepID=A0A1M6UIN4_9CLOT|nr:lactate utilization protein [Clostridium cavendishii]SHK69031.1 Uncharacterised ACR, YkgG family COG1556 [Clostridium cavendishii DSM 21758]